MMRRLYVRVDDSSVPNTLYDTLFRQKDSWCCLLRSREGYGYDARLDEGLGDEDEIGEGFTNGYPGEMRSDIEERIKRGALHPTYTWWQLQFPNVRELDIMISVIDIHDSKEDGCCCFGHKFWARLEILVNRTEMEWKVDHVSFTFDLGHSTCRTDHTWILNGLKERATRRQGNDVEEWSSENYGESNAEEEESSESSSEDIIADSGSSFHPECETDSSDTD